MNVITPSKDQSKFQMVVEVGAAAYEGYLTYELSRKTAPLRRDVIIMRSAKMPSLLHAIVRVRSQYEAFERLAGSIERGATGRVHGAKEFVNAIYKGHISDPCYAIAVHRFGPVPVFILPEPFRLQSLETGEQFRIGLYPRYRVTTVGNVAGVSNRVVRDAALVETLTIQPSVIGRRYFEDIGELFFDIEHHSSEIQAIKNIRLAEARIGESLQTKIAAITHPKNAIDATYGRIFRQFQHGFRDEFFLWRYATAIFRLLIEGFLAAVAFDRLGKPYGNTLEKAIAALEEEGRRPNNQYVDRGVTSFLYKLRKSYARADAAGSITDLIAEYRGAGYPAWGLQALEFARFTAQLKQLGEPTFLARSFVSDNHYVDVVSRLESLIEPTAALCDVKVAFFREELPGIWLAPEIAARIWTCDALIAIFPVLEPGRDYQWILAEMDHALLLNRKIIILIQSGVEVSAIERDISTVTLPIIFNDTRLKEDRRERLKRHINETVRIHFKDSDLDTDSRLARDIRRCMEQLSRDHTENRLRACAKQWDASQRSKLGKVLFTLQAGELTATAIRRKSGVSGFMGLWQKVKTKPLIIKDKPFSFIIQVRRGNKYYYQEGVTSIIRALQPSCAEEDVIRIISSFLSEL